MNSPEDVKLLSREDLLALVAELQGQVVTLQEQVAQLAASNQTLVAENEKLQRSAKRQAAPFSRGTRTRQPSAPAGGLERVLSLSAKVQAPRKSPNLPWLWG